jgi:hypothetical protein
MKIEDYVKLMKLNQEFYNYSESDINLVAKLNLESGVSESHYRDGKLIAVTGIRCYGIGEPWFITIPELRDEPFFLFREIKKTLPRMADACNLWRMYATSKINDNFLKHLNFKPEEMFVWTRTG